MILTGDLFDLLPTLDADSFDACITDPPYGIGFMGKEWDTFTPSRIQGQAKMKQRKDASLLKNANVRGRKRSPAMSPSQIEYDRTLIGQRGFQEWTRRWAVEVYRVLKPGAYLPVCGAPRSFHRMTCGLEDAGFEIRDCFSWLFGQGFPKSLNLGEGRGTALKPAWEPIILARKPFKGTVKGNLAQHGTGSLNIDDCRLDGVPPDEYRERLDRMNQERYGADAVVSDKDLGRWPANVVLDDYMAPIVDEQAGELSTGEWPSKRTSPKFQGVYEGAFPGGQGELSQRAANAGGASRFYYVAKPSRAERDAGTEHLRARQRDDTRKAGNVGGDNPRNRGLQPRGNYHPTVKPVDLMRWLVRLVTPPRGHVLDCFAGSGTTGMACKYEMREFTGIEREAEYVTIAEARIAGCVPLLGAMLESPAQTEHATPSLFSDD